MKFAIIDKDIVVNVILADTLEVAEQIADGLEVCELETLKNQASILDDRDPDNSFLVIPNISINWFRDPNTKKWFAPKPEGNFEWNELAQNWLTWVEPIKLWLTEFEFKGYNDGTWTPPTNEEITE
jgi:hypothetical protein